ncbi:hypothetical protein VTN31DRAFT_3389 [Thermomyces dupontii]|uniref:uncharacterized protein n=1 Tax=Talaromyces thermophilus TaxID=28565 RepID=UPI003742C5C1
MPSTSGMREDANTSEEQQRQQQQESSPLPLKPGPRASRLQDVYEKALLATLKANSYDNFAACFPTPARHVPASLASVHRQLNAKLEESAKSEFAEILRERDVVRKLNDLDRLVGEARMRKQKAEEEGNGEGDPPPHTLGADELYRAHLKPHLQNAQASLNAELNEVQAENARLTEKILEQRKEIDSLLSSLETVMGDLETAAKASTEFTRNNKLRQDSVKIDEEVKARID